MEHQPHTLKTSFTKLNRLLKLDKQDIAAAYTMAIVAGLVQLSLPLGIQSILNFVLAGSFSTSIIVLITIVVGGVFVNGLLQVRLMQLIEKVRQKIFVRFSLEYSERLPKLNIEKLDNVYLPEQVNRFFETVVLQKSIDKLLIDLPAAIIQVLLGSLLISLYHPVFIVFGLSLVIIVIAIIRFSSARGFETALKASTYKYEVAAWLQEIARMIKTFKYTRGTSLHMKRTDGLVTSYLRSRTEHFSILLVQFWSLVTFKVLITAAMLIIGTYLLLNQQINVGQFIAADIVIIAIIASIEKIITNLDTLYDSLVAIEKIDAIAGAGVEKTGKLNLDSEHKGVTIEFKDVSFGYNEQEPVLRTISFSAQAGEFIQITGASGSGKSTVLRLLTGAYNEYSGQVLIDGLPVANYQVESLRRQTGILLGNQDIFQATIWDNLTMGNTEVSLKEVNELCSLTGLSAFVQSSSTGYDTILMPVGSKLPFYVRKNILLIRALLGKSKLLLLEEPFDHLPADRQQKLVQYIKQRAGATVLITTKNDSLYSLSDKTLVLERGSIKSNSIT